MLQISGNKLNIPKTSHLKRNKKIPPANLKNKSNELTNIATKCALFPLKLWNIVPIFDRQIALFLLFGY